MNELSVATSLTMNGSLVAMRISYICAFIPRIRCLRALCVLINWLNWQRQINSLPLQLQTALIYLVLLISPRK